MNLENYVIKKVLKPENSPQFYFESIKFKIPTLQKACEDLIVMHFPKIVEKGIEFIKELPIEQFIALCSADNLYIQDEKIVVDLIETYIHARDDLPLLTEEDPSKNWSHLREDEKTKRLEEEKKGQEEEKKKQDEEAKKQADEFAKLDELGKIQSKWRKRVEESHTKALERLTMRRLTKA